MKLKLIFSAIKNRKDGEMRLALNERAFDQYYSWGERYITGYMGFILDIRHIGFDDSDN